MGNLQSLYNEPDWNNHTLALVKEGKILFSSDRRGIRPIVDCVRQFTGKARGCTLYDKVVGMASARCIIYSGAIGNVVTKIISKGAEKLLKEAAIPYEAKITVDKILNADHTSTCPMELKAMAAKSNRDFYETVLAILYPD